MAEESQSQSSRELPGLPLDVFEAAVHALVELRDSGKYMVFFGRQTSVKFIGELQDVRDTLGKRLEREVSGDEAKDALVEIRNFCKAAAFFETSERTLRFVEHQIYDDEFERLDEPVRKEFRDLLQAKIALVSEHLYTDAIKQRSRRMESATGPCLEELDVEVVEERHDDFRGRKVGERFLRLRLRYSEGSLLGSSWFLFSVMPWGGVGPQSAASFELECDESDIDLLIFRLTAAKRLLLRSKKEPEESAGD
ncbi:MAG TPA: hypothetical protein VMY37_37855 [Thermoguttaceae bacterium]|nr:hypothetical protein [Thermoguttaceae bacterium]